MHSRMARYAFIGDPQDLARRAEDSMLPLFQAQPGFKAYSITRSNGEIISFSIWETAEQAEAANAVSRDWVADNLAGQVELKETRVGEILLNTALGVRATAGANA
ncbi:MAG: hypothetical protein ACRDNY_00470 [Gaiellaceae bacterium]